MSDRVLLTVSGTIPDDLEADLAAGRRPRPDYHAMAEVMGAELLDHTRARLVAGRAGWLLERLAGANAMLAWACFRNRRGYRLIFTDGEQVGLPLAVLFRLFGRRGVRHMMIVHILTVTKKRRLFRLFRLGSLIDRMVVYSSRQRELISREFGYPSTRIALTPFAVDCVFWSRDRVDVAQRPLVCSAGLEFRDYPTLIEAARGLDVDVVLAAASPWSKRGDGTDNAELPTNVTVGRLDFVALRDLYGAAQVVAVPLVQTDFQAGITTILEAMSMGTAIVCSRTRGQTDTLVDGETGLYVEPGDIAGVRETIQALLLDGATRLRLGDAARAWAWEHADVHVYAQRLAGEVDVALTGPGTERSDR